MAAAGFSRPNAAEWVLWALVALGVGYAVARFAMGLGAIANINNAYPWGWWTGFGIMTLIAFGACGFTVALLAEVFGRHRYAPLVRPALVMGLLFYVGYALILLIELGRPWKAWMVFLSWSPHSALFEVAWCATIYTICLMIEFSKVVTERYRWPRLLAIASALYLPVVVLGVAISHMHQSSLGTLLTIVPLKVDARWWSEILPATFLVSAYIAGLALITVEHIVATRLLRLQTRVDLLAGLARIQVWLVSFYLALRVADLVYRGAVDSMLKASWLSLTLWVELVVGFLVPLAIFAIPQLRTRLWALATGASLLALGVMINRLNVAVIGLKVRHWETYFPSLGEFATTFGVVAAGILVFGWIVRNFPIHEEPPLEEAR